MRRFAARTATASSRLPCPHPHDYSRLAFFAQQALLAEAGLEPAGTLIEMFSQFDASAVQKAGLLPLWLIFNTHDSLAFLESMRPHLEQHQPVFFSPLVTFSITPDLAPWDNWTKALQGLDWRNIGARPSHYPADALALTNWFEPLRRWADNHPQPANAKLSPEKLQAIAAAL